MEAALLTTFFPEYTKSIKFYDLKSCPIYVWLREQQYLPEVCYRIVDIDQTCHTVVLESGHWLAPIAYEDRRKSLIILMRKYPDYVSIKSGSELFLKTILKKKETSDTVAWSSHNRVKTLTTSELFRQFKNYIRHQTWKCRYCKHVNHGGFKCNGIYNLSFPVGGPSKTNNNALSEYIYFLSKSQHAKPQVLPFKQPFGWLDVEAMAQWKKSGFPSRCQAQRCVHTSHLNHSEQVLSFPREKWPGTPGIITNTETFFLPGAMLGHQTIAKFCPKCQNQLKTLPLDPHIREVLHSWWIIESLYWLKAEIYNKKMQHLTLKDSANRYLLLKQKVEQLISLNIDDYVYTAKDGFTMTVPFKNIVVHMKQWLDQEENYIKRFEKNPSTF